MDPLQALMRLVHLQWKTLDLNIATVDSSISAKTFEHLQDKSQDQTKATRATGFPLPLLWKNVERQPGAGAFVEAEQFREKTKAEILLQSSKNQKPVDTTMFERKS